MRLPRVEDIAILFSSELAASYGTAVLPLSTVAKRHGVSQLFLKKIARSLKKAGIVESKEGAKGGYILSRSPASISAWDVMQAVTSGPSHINSHGTVHEHCPLNDQCLPQIIRSTISSVLKEKLSGLTLKDLTTL